MSRDVFRRLFAEGAIGLSLVAGGYFLGVEPMQRAAAERRHRADALFLCARDNDAVRTRAEIDRLNHRVTDIQRAGNPDELEVMDRLHRAAESLGIEVQNIEKRDLPPSQPPASTPPGGHESAERGAAAPTEGRFGFAVSATGSYARAVVFLDVIQRQMGYSRVEAATLTPAGDSADPRVTLTLTTSHWWFDTGPARAANADAARAIAPTEEP